MTRISPRWEHVGTVAGFLTSPPNEELLRFAGRELDGRAEARAGMCLDIGCGAARNAAPLAELGFEVTGTDLSESMLAAAAQRVRTVASGRRVHFLRAPMTALPLRTAVFDLVVAHGIWNLARSGDEFRAAVAEAARVAVHGAGLFLFTFSRLTLPPDAVPDPGELFVFSSWNGEPQCFLTEGQIADELGRVGFVAAAPLTVYNMPRRGECLAGRPVIFEGTFRRQ